MAGIFNRVFYYLATMPHWTTRKAFDLMVKANVDYWTPTSTFQEGACGVLSAATDLGYPIAAVVKAFAAVDISMSACRL